MSFARKIVPTKRLAISRTSDGHGNHRSQPLARRLVHRNDLSGPRQGHLPLSMFCCSRAKSQYLRRRSLKIHALEDAEKKANLGGNDKNGGERADTGADSNKAFGTNVSLFLGGDEDNRKGGSRFASKISALAPLITSMIVSLGIAVATPGSIWSYIPFLYLASKVGKPRNTIENLQGILLGVVWNAWAGSLAQVLTLGHLPLAFGAALPYACLLSTLLRPNIAFPGPHGYVLIRALLDPPIMITVVLIDLLGGQFLHDGNGNFLSLVDDRVCMSSMPLASNIPALEAANVKSVVNMCLEYPGPQSAYKAAGIEQLRLPTLDTSQPSFESLVLGVEFIKKRLEQEPGSRVLIHCKGGRGRAAAMAVSFFINQGLRAEDAIAMMKAKRAVVEPVVTTYPSVVQYREYCGSISEHANVEA